MPSGMTTTAHYGRSRNASGSVELDREAYDLDTPQQDGCHWIGGWAVGSGVTLSPRDRDSNASRLDHLAIIHDLAAVSCWQSAC